MAEIEYKYELKEIDQMFVRGDIVVRFKDGSKQGIDDEIFDVDSLLEKIFPKGKKVLLCYWKDTENPYSDWRFDGFAEVKKIEKATGRPTKYGKAYTLLGAGLRFPGPKDRIIGLKR